MAAHERSGTAAERVGGGTGEAIRKVYQPDAACDERFDALLERIDRVTACAKGKKS